MREKEYPPLLPNGFKDIDEKEMMSVFVDPFNHGHDHRMDLYIEFGRFLNRFKELELTAEVWIDGSFGTSAPDPSDIDVVFFFEKKQIDELKGERKELFERLFQSRKFIKNIYKVEVFYAQIGNEVDYYDWKQIFGTSYDNTAPKGIYRIYYN